MKTAQCLFRSVHTRAYPRVLWSPAFLAGSQSVVHGSCSALHCFADAGAAGGLPRHGGGIATEISGPGSEPSGAEEGAGLAMQSSVQVVGIRAGEAAWPPTSCIQPASCVMPVQNLEASACGEPRSAEHPYCVAR